MYVYLMLCKTLINGSPYACAYTHEKWEHHYMLKQLLGAIVNRVALCYIPLYILNMLEDVVLQEAG